LSAKTTLHRISSLLTASALLLFASATAVRAQNAPRAQATRAELEAALIELEKYAASSGYSSRLRNEKAREAAMIKTRLADGDLQVGDQIDIQVIGQAVFSDSFMVSSGRVLTLPGLPDIPLKGVLRSEAREYLTAQLGKYIKDPQIRVSTKIRLSVFGSVGRPGFYQIPADVLATDAIMIAGGPAADVDMGRVFVRRGTTDIWPSDVLQEAMRRGLTLDQLNLQAGDELVVDPRKRPGAFSFTTAMGIFGGLASSVYFFSRIF
jgi:protein involved in polysaccharide export with SLBB domain